MSGEGACNYRVRLCAIEIQIQAEILENCASIGNTIVLLVARYAVEPFMAHIIYSC